MTQQYKEQEETLGADRHVYGLDDKNGLIDVYLPQIHGDVYNQ